MNLDDTQRSATHGKLIFDPSADWVRITRREEPDLAVDGLRRSSVIERILRLFGKRKA